MYMKSTRRISQQGFGHILLVIIIFAVLGVVGFAGYKVVSGKKTGPAAADTTAAVIAEPPCAEPDKNICQFRDDWVSQQYYTITTKAKPADKGAYDAVYKTEGNGKFQITVSGETPYEMIVIGNDSYTKAPNGVWWKKTNKPEEVKNYQQSFDLNEDKAGVTAKNEPASQTTYKNLGTEVCGDAACYKYQVIDSANTETTEYIWFGTSVHALYRTRSESKNGGYSESTFSYANVSIKVPSPVKQLGSNQHLVPGQNEPTTLPGTGGTQSLDTSPDGSTSN
jgi:hypothetical protein